MLSYDLRHVVPVCVRWIGIVRTIGNVPRILAKPAAISIPTNQINARQGAVESVLKNPANRNIGSSLPVPHIVENDMVCGVAKDKFIQQGWIKGRGQPGDQTYSRAL